MGRRKIAANGRLWKYPFHICRLKEVHINLQKSGDLAVFLLKTIPGREIERSEYAVSTNINARNYIQHYDQYRKRQELNEHVFGAIKRVWNYYYTNLKGLKKVNGEMSLILTVYNMKRTINILGFDKLIEKLRAWKPKYKKSWVYKHLVNNLTTVISFLEHDLKFSLWNQTAKKAPSHPTQSAYKRKYN